MGLDIKDPEHKVSLEDGTGVTLKSKTVMNISAVKGVKLTAKTMTIEAAGPLNLLRDPESGIGEVRQVQKHIDKRRSNKNNNFEKMRFLMFVHEGGLTFADVTNLDNDKQEVLRAIYYTLHNAGYSNIIIAGVLGSVCTEGNIGQFEDIPYGSEGGNNNYYKLTWNEAKYYNQFPHKETNSGDANHEYANSYSGKTPWQIPDFTCQEFMTMLNVGIAEKELVFGVGASQSSYPNKHQSYIDAIKGYCAQNRISMNTVIDKDLAVQLESLYIKKRVDEILPDDNRYQTAGDFMDVKGWSPDQIVPEVTSRIPEVANSDELKDVCRATIYWYVEEEACSGASKGDAANRAADAVKCYNAIKDYESGK